MNECFNPFFWLIPSGEDNQAFNYQYLRERERERDGQAHAHRQGERMRKHYERRKKLDV